MTSSHPKVAEHLFARRFDIEPPEMRDAVAEWMLRAFTGSDSGVLPPAARWFEKGFDNRHPYRHQERGLCIQK